MSDIVSIIESLKGLDAIGAIIVIFILYKSGLMDKKIFKKNGNGTNGIKLNPEKDNPKVSNDTFLHAMEKTYEEMKKKVYYKDFENGLKTVNDNIKEIKEMIQGTGGIVPTQSAQRLEVNLMKRDIESINEKLDVVHSIRADMYDFSENANMFYEKCMGLQRIVLGRSIQKFLFLVRDKRALEE